MPRFFYRDDVFSALTREFYGVVADIVQHLINRVAVSRNVNIELVGVKVNVELLSFKSLLGRDNNLSCHFAYVKRGFVELSLARLNFRKVEEA